MLFCEGKYHCLEELFSSIRSVFWSEENLLVMFAFFPTSSPAEAILIKV